MPQQVSEAGNSTNLTASGSIFATDVATMTGFYVNSTTGGTLIIKRGGSSGTALSGTITPDVGFHPFPVEAKDLYATIAGTINITFFYRANP